MADVIRNLRIAIILNGEDFRCGPVSRPFFLEGYPPMDLEFFGAAPEAPGEAPVRPLAELRPGDYHLVLDAPGAAAGLAGFLPGGRQHLVTGPQARLMAQISCRLEELRHKQEINVGIINQAVDAIITINEDHVIVGYNDGAEKMMGYSRAEALGQDLKLIIPPPHKEDHKEYVRRYVATRKARVIGKHVRLTAQRADGTEFPMSISFSVAEIRGALFFTGIIRDITEYKMMEDRVLATERLAAIGTTVAHIAHEIKNPLLIIGGFAHQLQKSPGLDDKSRQKLGIIVEEVERLEGMMGEMRDFIRPPEPKKTRGSLETLVDDTVEFFQETLQENLIEVRRRREDPLPPASFDPRQIRQVLINLFKNALEAMPRGGELTIATRVKDGNAEISITDTGQGMSPEVAANIFQPYYTTKEKGTGLGLAICQFIVERQHGGCILVDSAPGKGSTFTIQIPLGEAGT